MRATQQRPEQLREQPPAESELPLPPGRRVLLPGRGTTFVREVAGPPGAPTLLLLHGWIASGGLNWFQAFGPLGRQFRVVAPDLRGHGRGIKSWRHFRLADCADDAAALIDRLDCGPVIAVGYSMGGPVAQLLWHRHAHVVSGLVLCATGCFMMPGLRSRFVFSSAMSALAGTTRLGQLSVLLPRQLAETFVPKTAGGRPGSLARWAAAEMGRHDWRLLLEAGVAIGRYDARSWIGDVDVPTAVVVTTRDRAVGVHPQLQLARRIPGATLHRLEDGHVACANAGFGEPLAAACREVGARAADRRRLYAV